MADYIPITDQEIEPEAPITSILQHKLRDNPIAIAGGATGAPLISGTALMDNTVSGAKLLNNSVTSSKIAASAVGTGEISTLTGQVEGGPNNVLRPAGFYEVGFETSIGSLARDVHVLKTASNLSRATWIGISNAGCTYYNRYFSAGSFDFVWYFFLKNKTTGEISGRYVSCYHCAYGQTNYTEHPYHDVDLSVYDIYVINLTKEQYYSVQIGQIPKIGGGFLDPTSIAVVDIDHFSEHRDFFDTFNIVFSIDYDPLDWLSDEFYIGLARPEIGINNVPKMQIPEPLNVTRVGVTLI